MYHLMFIRKNEIEISRKYEKIRFGRKDNEQTKTEGK